MKILLNQINFGDIAALGVLLGTASKLLPSVAALLAIVYYGFVIYDRVRYGPELEKRMLWDHIMKRKTIPHETSDP